MFVAISRFASIITLALVPLVGVLSNNSRRQQKKRVLKMKNSRLLVALIILALACVQLSSAQPLTPKPLHTDRSLAALIAVRGQFASLIVDEQRPLTLPVWAADFSPNEPVDFDQLLSRSFSESGTARRARLGTVCTVWQLSGDTGAGHRPARQVGAGGVPKR
ncbi:MAG: hypothetical protein KatS3mg022_2317 [Armatimonadota bacterium]|nr:MAG: hypothetical protein KatS3mg022_2317 [Armatimonadota bacterium]